VTPAPIHYESAGLDVEATAALVAEVRASIARASAAALEELTASMPTAISSLSLRALPEEFPEDVAVQRQPPYEARADAVMYRKELVRLAEARGWVVRFYRAKDVEDQAAALLGDRAHEVLCGPRAALGPPWAKDHRVALAATIVAGRMAVTPPE
jgi:hypothetical protein